MSQVSVRTTGNLTQAVTQYAIECPFCHTNVIPNYLFFHENRLFSACPNEACKHHFILAKNNENRFPSVEANAIPKSKIFSEIITSVSNQFTSIYNQAYHAEQVGLDQICGVGYRKAIEFLIKDYLLLKITDDNQKENIKNKFLGNCIQEDVQDTNIKEVAKRAVWLGNDETHYVRHWEDKDVQYLKKLIDLTVRWIENEIETERVLQEMT